jgi:hypothetical protein
MGRIESRTWAQEEFGHAALGHALRGKALVRMASGCAERPAGKVTEVFRTSADRESAYRFVENESVPYEAVMQAAHEAAARRCMDASFVYVPLDKSSLTLTDRAQAKGFGMVGTSKRKNAGLNVLSALAITPDGIPQGVAYQHYWRRPRQRKPPRSVSRKKPLEERESYLWLEAMMSIEQTFATQENGCRPWFQIDREGDVSSALICAVENGYWLTVRGIADRRLSDKGDEAPRHVRERLESEPVLGSYQIVISARPGRSQRNAELEVRAAKVTLSVPIDKGHHRRKAIDITAVLVTEANPPEGIEPLDWLLLTTHPFEGYDDALAIIYGYTQRWRIEEFHRAWKSGVCNVEDTQLRTPNHVIRWAVVLASVACRVVRLTYLARALPNEDATIEFSSEEITVIRILAEPSKPSSNPSVKEVIYWLASLGGYTGPKVSGGPPGFIVLSRGLDYIRPVLDFIHLTARQEDP